MPSSKPTIKWKRSWKRHVDNKMRGAYGETDYAKKTIRINKRRHKSKTAARIAPNKNGTESLINTILHEETHRKHPKMKEKTVRKKATRLATALGRRAKKRLYSLFK